MEELFSREDIAVRIAALGKEISGYYREKALTMIVLMNGGAFFGCELAKNMDLPFWFDSLRASSYIHDRRNDEVEISKTLKLSVVDRHILLVDDVFDSGNTIGSCRKYLLEAGALSVRSAVLMNKNVPGRKSEPDWAGFSAPDRYLVGYGLDSEEFYRNLPFVGAMD